MGNMGFFECTIQGAPIAFIDILRSDFEGNNKLIWLLVVIFVPFIGPIAYFFHWSKTKK
jgi:hypothetical protein